MITRGLWIELDTVPAPLCVWRRCSPNSLAGQSGLHLPFSPAQAHRAVLGFWVGTWAQSRKKVPTWILGFWSYHPILQKRKLSPKERKGSIPEETVL